MALGSNIEYKSRALFQAALDEKSAQKLENRFVELSKKASEMSKEEFVKAFSSLGQEINKALTKLNIQPIDMEKLIQLPQAEAFSQLGTEFGTRFAEGFQGAVTGGSGIGESIKKQVQQLEAEQNKLLSLQKSLPKSLKRYEYLSGLSSVEKGDVRAFSLDDIKKMSPDGNADSLAQNFTDDYYNALNALEQLDAGTEQYYQTLLKVYEASSNVFRMQATIDKHPGLIKDKNILMDYGYETLQETVQNELLARDKDFYNFIEQESSLLDQIPAKLTEIEQRLNAVRQSNPEIVNQEDASAGLKTLDEIEAAYKRILNAHGKIGKQGTYIQNALDFDPTTSKQGIKALYDAYTKIPQDAPWEVQYQALLKYVKLYESYLNSSNATYRNKVTKEGNEFTKLYEQLKPMEANAENMLRNVLNMANKAPLIGMGDASDVEASQKVATESQKKAEAEAKARTESEHKAKADAEAAASAEKEKLAREASAKAAQQAAQVAEQERVAKEATAKASKDTNSSYVAGGILDNPMFSNMFGKAKNEAEEKQVANEGSAKAAQEELGATQKTTAELEKQQKLLLYRRVEGQADVSRLSGRSIDALYDKAGKPIIQGALEMGFGGFGDGLYTTTLGAAKDLLPGKGDFSFFEFDASGYNLLVNKTVEQAQALQSFLLSLQKLVGAGTLLDTSELTHIEDLSNDQLFEKAQQIFQNFSMSKQQFDAWIENAKKESEAIAKLFAKGQVPSNRHNFGTRFMQTLGYDGVLNQTGDLDIDGNYQGSVIYDPKDDMKQNARIFQNKAEFASYLKAEAQAHQENTVAINKETQAQESLNQKKTQQAQIEQSDNDGAEVAEENAKTEAIKQQNGALQENINLKTQANGQGVGGTRIGTITPTQTVPSGTISAEATELEAVRAKVLEVTNAINTKTQAFTNEEAEVKRVVTSEIASLDLLEQKVTAIKGTLEGLLSNLKTGSDNVGVGLSNITVTVNKNDNVDTKAISTYVADAPATENTLVAIKSVLDNINSKVQTGVSNRGVSSTTTSSDDNALVLYDDSTNTQRSSGGSSQIPTEQINTALTALLKYKTTLQEAHQLSGDLENGINSLYMELSQVSDRAGLSTWNEHFKQFKNASSILQTLIKDYQALGQAQARAAMETDPMRQMQYLDNAQIIQDRIATKMVDVNVGDDRFEEARQRAYNLTTHELQQRQELADARRVETERTNAENAAIREQVQLVNQWIGLVDRMATLKTQIDSGAFDEMATARMMQQYENLRAQVDRIRPLIQTTDDVWNRVGNAYVDGRDTANTTMAANALPQLAKLYQQLGTAQANFEGKETSVTETAVKQIREKIEGQQRSLQLSQEELAILQQIASVAYRNQAEMLQSGTQDARIKEWGALTTRLESLNTQINSGEFNEAQVKAMKSEVALVERRIDELRPLIDMAEYNWNAMGSAVYKGREKGEDAILKQQVKNFKEQVKMSQKEAGLTRSGSVATKAENTLTNVMGIEGISESQIANLEQYQNKIVSLQSLIKQLRSQGSPVTDAQKQELVSQTVAVDNYTREIQELITNYERLSGPNAQSLNATSTLGLGASSEAYKQELTNAVQSFHKGRATIKSFDAETNTLTYTLKTGKGEFTQYAASIRQTDGALMSVRGTTTKAMGVFESIGKKIKEYSYYFTGSMMIMRAISEIKQGISIVRDIDSAMTELKKVTDETEESYDRFLNTAGKTSGIIGTTIADFTRATATFAKLGYDMTMASEMAEAATVYQNVGDGIESADDAAESIISTIKGFNLEASESMRIVDRFNEVGNKFSITSKGIGDALQRSASALSAGGNTLDESIGLITAANEVVQNPESVGNALKTLSLRLRGAKTELEEAGLETENMAETTATLQKKLLGLTSGKVDIMLDANTFKNSTQILREMSGAWEDMTDIQRAAALELMGGKRQANILSSIIQNFDTVESVIEASANSSNSALEENAKWMDSIEGRTKQFANALNTMWNNELNSDVIKWFVGLGEVIVQTIDALGLLPSAFIVVSLAIMKMNHMNIVEYFGSIGSSIANLNTKLGALAIRYGALSSTSSLANASMKQVTVGMLEQRLAAAGVNTENLKLILSKTGLANVSKTQAIASKSLVFSVLQEAIANKSLNATQAFSIAQKLGLIKVTKGLNSANANYIMQLMGLDRQQRINMISTLGLSMNTKKLTKEEIMNALAKNGIVDAAKKEQIANLMLLASQGKLRASLKLLGLQMKDFLAKNALLLSLTLAIAAIWGVTKAVDGLIQTSEELQEKLTESNNKLENTTSELKDLENQLKETSDAIKELQSQGTLSFTDQEELRRLKKQKKEIEDSIALKSELEKSQQKTVNKDAEKTYRAYKNKNFKNGKGMGEYAESGGKTGAWAGGAVGGLLLGGKIGAAIGSFIPIPVVGTILGYAAGALVGAAVGAAIGAAGGAIVSEAGQDVEEQLNDITSERAELQKKRDDAYKAYVADDQNKKLLKEYEDAEEKLSEYDTKMAEHVAEIQAMRNQMDWETATPSQRETIEEMDDFIDRYKIAMNSPGAVGDAIERIFDKEEYKGASEVIDSLIEKYKETEDDTILSEISTQAQQAQKDLEDVGLSVQDVVDYYTLEKGLFDSSTIKGIALQYAKGTEILQKFAEATAKSRKELGEKALGDDGIKRMKELQQGGTVDLFNRPRIDAEVLKDNGWTDAGDGTATVFTSTFSNKDKTVAMNFTPILPNGQVLSPDELTQYAEEVIAGTREDDLNLKVGATFEGENAIEAAETTAEEVHKLQEKYYKDPVKSTIEFEVDGKTKKIKWDDLFEEGKDGEFKAKEEEFSDMLKGMNEEASKTFISLAEKVKNGQLSWDQAMNAFNAKGLVASLEVANEKISAINTEMFADVKDDISGLIDTFGELSAVLESTAASMDLLNEAQVQMTNSGQISVKTALELMQSTDKWNEILVIEEGNLKLAKNAEQTLIQSKLDHIKVNLENALATVKAQIAAVEANSASYDFATTLDESTNIAVQEMSKSMITLVALMEAYASNGRISVSSAMASADKQIADLDKRLNSYKGPKKTKQETLSSLYKQQDQLEAMLGMYGKIDTVSEFKNNYDFEKTPGDKYKDGDSDTALEAIQKYYERQIKDLEGQQTYIENEIEKLEAQEQGVSADYYEKQIDLEEEKIALYEQERAELLKLKRTDEVADAIWEVEHAIQESTLRMIEFRKSIAELYATASDNISEAYDRRAQVIDDSKSYIENEISIRETKGELIPTSAYDDLIDQEQQARANTEAELNSLANLYWQGINNGELEVGSDEALDILEKIRQKKIQMQESDKQIAEYAEQQKDAYIAYYDKMMEAYSHRNNFFQSQSDYAQSYIDRLGVLNINVPDEAYEKMAEIQELNNNSLKEQLEFASSELDNLEANGIDKNDSRYIEKFNEVLDLEKQVYEGETKVLEYHQQIIDNHLDRLNQVVDRINHSISQLENVSSLISDEDVANEDGSWTAEGLTQAGMAYHQMEYNKQVVAEYAEEMEYLKEQFDQGKISEKEYTEKLQELTDGQWDAINAYKSAEDAIIDLNEARIDMIEDGLNKEIEAYQELIDLKKEELDAERNLYDFRKDIQKQTKDIAALERRIASMSGSTDASTIAERTKLEAELREAREGLDDTYYNHGMDSMSNALDDEMEAYEKSTSSYIESLRNSIKDTKLLIENTLIDVMANADAVMNKITELSGTYKFTLDPNLTEPWINASTQATLFKQNTDSEIGSLIGEGGIITVFGSEKTKTKLSGVFGAGSGAANQFALDVVRHMGSVETTVNSYTSGDKRLDTKLKQPWTDAESAPLHWSQESQRYMTQEVVGYAEQNYKQQLTDTLNYPWKNANAQASWGTGIQTVLDQAVKDAEEAGRKIAEALDVEPPSYESVGASGTGDTGKTGGSTPKPTGVNTGNEDVKTLQLFLNEGFGAGLTKDGKYGPATKAAMKKVQEKVGAKADGWYGDGTRDKIVAYWDKKAKNDRQNREWWDKWKPKLPAAMYAKGTMGTSSSGFAITDESWIGEEITLAAGKNGQLQYLKKGSAVMPADISANLVEWGKINPNMMNVGNITDGINLISNYINKPEIKVDVENFLKVGTVSRDTLPDLEKLMDKKIDTFAKQLNASIRKFK